MPVETYFIVKTLHILSSTILFGTGIGIAFFMFRSRFTSNVQEKFYAARSTVVSDYIFTLPAVIVQPLTGLWLVWRAGYDWTSTWLVTTYILYGIAGACWLPVVWIQIQLKNILGQCLEEGKDLSARYHRLFQIWCLLGVPAFVGLVAVFFLMVFKPQ